MIETTKITWISIDPIYRKIDYYPSHISKRLEKTYYNYHILQDYNNTNCGFKEFFNATVNIINRNNFYQTTPGFSMGRYGFKQPGYRSVQRIVIPDNKKIKVYLKKKHGEWRITNFINSEAVLEENVPNENIILLPNVYNELNTEILTYWSPEQLDSEIELEKNIVVWQWCLGTKEKQYDLLHLDDKWWIPYLNDQNKIIEEAFNQNFDSVTITIPFDNSKRIIEFNNRFTFATQTDEITGKKVRIIRRNIITVKKLIELLKNENEKIIEPEKLLKYIDENKIPHEFYCSISQDIMKDPVKTVDGFTYDYESIEKWLATSWKSPLTGLNLTSKLLQPNNELKVQIQEFFKKQQKNHNEAEKQLTNNLVVPIE